MNPATPNPPSAPLPASAANLPGKLIVAGGGTGGHVLAGVAVADSWRSRRTDGNGVLFVGAQGGLEEKLVPKNGYPLQLLKLGSLNRVSLSQRLRTLALLPYSILKSFWIVLRVRPSAVLGVGGYASGPLVLAARILRSLGLSKTRTAILEQNSVPGMTNRILGRYVDYVFCAFPGTEKRFPARARANAVILTGNPVRSTMQLMESATREPFTILVTGGSQGALGINTLVLEALPFLEDLKARLRFVHQTGEKDYERVREGHARAGSDARVEKFIYNMPEAYQQASLLVCRSGSSTLSEIAAVGRAAVLVPFPFASDNHQEVNARVFTDAGAAFLMVQGKSKGEDLARLIRQAIENPARMREMEQKVTAFYRPKAAQDIVSKLLEGRSWARPGNA